MPLSAYIAGLASGLSLIVAIGAQNAFVLQRGLRGEHVFAVCLACALSDAVLIAAGVAGLQQMLAMAPWLDAALRYAGAAFLVWYGARSLRSALRSQEALVVGAGGAAALGPTLAATLALTWLNPHVYLDTMVLLGTLSTRHPGAEAFFAFGAITGSFAFFFGLGYGAAWLRPLFARPSSWRVLEGVIAAVMWSIALGLLMDR
ncbi:Lysine exporter protein (LYSE/YGGA) [Ancylobacter novellus DSM 506]|uniref:Lysine exporter protein (LYSE/YGGA) n=1 Tax=Ancylobacter novellus (strain ATCC 8093 / DSM 506 / JCM 20403 / CCM 1077 / IAM 12100 / NBRC 12443 / NCIMB 10456) TaxID=639283 RepID=D7A235_ANCN5|nr:LysE/ArgO family amino acid transporter [Ancylobacter novellus]ADH87651.1 Lysine exporter protein (LYSE/YGGA) [Ancylobacter novellus DSM 506]